MINESASNLKAINLLTGNYKTIITVLFFLVVLIIGINSYADYGISYDEPAQRNHGVGAVIFVKDRVIPSIISLEILEGIPDYPEDRKKVPVLFHLPIILIEEALGLDPDQAQLWETRHLYTFLWFFIGLIFLYKLIAKKYSWLFGLAGCIFMVLSPRIFAHSFYNVKDLVFLSTVMVVLYFSFRYLERKDLTSAILLALTLAIANNVRIIGLMFLALVIFFTIIDWLKILRDKRHINPINYSKLTIISPLITAFLLLLSLSVLTLYGFVSAIFLVLIFSLANLEWIRNFREEFNKEFTGLIILLFLTPFLTILFWPGAWRSPIDSIVGMFIGSAQFTGWDNTVLYLGELVRGSQLPWHYIPVWISITTPIAYLLLFITGLIIVLKLLANNQMQLYENSEDKESLFCLLSLSLPVIAAIILGSTLYDGWRHNFFIYAPFIIISIKGFYFIFNNYKKIIMIKVIEPLFYIMLILFGLNIIHTAYWMIINHPFQYVYFNELAGNRVAYTFERDYWGLSAREGLEFIVANDDRQIIKIYDKLGGAKHNLPMLNTEDQDRTLLVEMLEADYIIESYRRTKGTDMEYKEIYSVEVDGITIMSVFDLRADKAKDNKIEQ